MIMVPPGLGGNISYHACKWLGQSCKACLLYHEELSILRGRKSVLGINIRERGNGKKRTTLSSLQTPGSRISILLAVGTPSTGSGNLYCQWELSLAVGMPLGTYTASGNSLLAVAVGTYTASGNSLLAVGMPFGENRASWSEKLDDALWAFRTTYKTSIGCTPYKLVYGKSCHLPIELEHKAYWALKHVNFDLKIAGDHQRLQLNELNELRDQA
nr:reverse transcriptase domain-containing protein [Tanacetum cinerariifolium]